MLNKFAAHTGIVSVVLCLGLFGCDPAMLNSFLKKSDQSEKILRPSSAEVSPNMDFNKIRSVAVFPLFPGGGTLGPGLQSYEDPAFAESVVQAFSAELTAKQSQWQIRSPGDVLAAINKARLGRGYKNLQADYNTTNGQLAAFTKETKRFLSDLATAMKVDAFVFGSYDVASGTKLVRTPLGSMSREVTQTSVSVVLFYTKGQVIWWRATSKIASGDRTKLVANISKSLASYVGKGTLRQL